MTDKQLNQKQRSLRKLVSYTYSLSFLLSLSFLACDGPNRPSQNQEEPPPCDLVPEQELCQEMLTPAHSPDCIAVDGDLCLISFSWTDQGPRVGVLSPNEEFVIKEISIFNAGQREITLVELNSLLATADLEAPSGELYLNELSGKAWFTEESALSADAIASNEQSCQQGSLESQRACTFPLDLALKIKETAPNNAVQRVEIAVDSRRGARFEWSLPLLVVHSSGNLSLDTIQFEDSSEDGQIQAGDALRLKQIKLLNHSFAPYRSMKALVVFEDEQITSLGELHSWEDIEKTGMASSMSIHCEAARRIDESIEAGECDLDFTSIIKVNPQLANEDILSFALYLKEQDHLLEDHFDFSLELAEWETELGLESVVLSADENRDRYASPSERVGINQFMLENNSISALSLRGRVVIDSGFASLSSSSDLSINETMLRDDFYEQCPALSTCTLQSNLLLEIASDAPIGEQIAITLELVDHTGEVYELRTQLEVRLPDVDLELNEFEVKQDTLDRDLSAGERGVISYLKFVNQGSADANALRVTLSSDSDYIQFEDQDMLSFDLNTHSNFLDERSGDCPSRLLENDGYCYRRPEAYFNISESAPLGELIQFTIQVSDAWGTEHIFNEQITVF